MQDLILVGQGGCMREILWQIENLNEEKATWNVVGYVDIEPSRQYENADISVRVKRYPYLGEDEYLLSMECKVNVAICVGDSKLRRKIAEKYAVNQNILFPPIILGRTVISESANVGKGCIISMDSRVSVDVTLGDFVFLNIGAMVCHEGKIGAYTTLSPHVSLAGRVTVGRECDIGINATSIQGITIGDRVVIGAGAVIVSDIESDCTAVGIPAKEIKYKL